MRVSVCVRNKTERLDQLQVDVSKAVFLLVRLEELFDGLEILLMNTIDRLRARVERGLNIER